MVIALSVSLPPPLAPLSRLWRAYEHQLEHRPVLTQSCTSAVLWGVGDVLAQRLADTNKSAGRQKCSIETRRTALTSLFGAAFIGPAGHVWYSWLDKLALHFGPEGSMRFLSAKVAADATIWSAAMVLAFFMWGELVIEQGTMSSFKEQVKTEFLPTYLAEVAAWPPIMAAIFTKLPAKHHLLAVNLFTVCDVVFLSMIRSGAYSVNSPCTMPSNTQQQQTKQQQQQQKANKKQPAKKQQDREDVQQMAMVPALASVTSGNAGPSKATGVPVNGFGVACSQMMQVFEAWVAPQHKPV